ncbi:BON domain-containing protein [Burkholderia multivorans]|uniref:BON domain-containing protein n=1 Tax=Burkholderia multivorans TaxID=87883 RepID=UPI0018C74FC5|nr:BON domain-containing protein [Burkholderia multivorans]MBU9398665.1 BON domain-containing protein [Burkholderia multivorans]
MLAAFSTSTRAQSTARSTASAATVAPTNGAKAARAANRKLAHRVENALTHARGLNAARLIVTAREGHVTLSGAVTYNEQIAIAVDAARKVEGVIEVENRIRVTGASL